MLSFVRNNNYCYYRSVRFWWKWNLLTDKWMFNWLLIISCNCFTLFILVLAICTLTRAAYLYFKQEICMLIKSMTSHTMWRICSSVSYHSQRVMFCSYVNSYYFLLLISPNSCRLGFDVSYDGDLLWTTRKYDNFSIFFWDNLNLLKCNLECHKF
jgi:hypothetical protein